jgi:hypothetical protein
MTLSSSSYPTLLMRGGLMKSSLSVIGGLLTVCMLVLGATALAQEQPAAIPEQPGAPPSTISPGGEKPAEGQPRPSKKGKKANKQKKSHKKKKTQDADR